MTADNPRATTPASKLHWLSQPWRDLLDATERLVDDGARAWLVAGVAFVAAWFVYVPVHELLHALGCLASGGEVTRLEVAPQYGGALLARIFPFVVSGSSYAGQLTGFDTHGNDGVYLATVLAPYVLTIFPGVALLRRATVAASPLRAAVGIGSALPLAFAPFLSLPGDYYEAGSIVMTRIAASAGVLADIAALRSDDVFKLAEALRERDASSLDWTLVAVALVGGFLLALLTYHLGTRAARLGRGNRAPAITENRT